MNNNLPQTLSGALRSAYLAHWQLLLLWAQITPPDHSAAIAPAEISEEELEAFAKSYVEFDTIRTVAEMQFGAANTAQEKDSIEKTAVAKFGAVLEREGLTMARFSALYQSNSTNDGLRQKVLKLIKDAQAKS